MNKHINTIIKPVSLFVGGSDRSVLNNRFIERAFVRHARAAHREAMAHRRRLATQLKTETHEAEQDFLKAEINRLDRFISIQGQAFNHRIAPKAMLALL